MPAPEEVGMRAFWLRDYVVSGSRLLAAAALLASVFLALLSSSCKESAPAKLRFVDSNASRSHETGKSGLVVVTHGWIEKGSDAWPQEMASAISSRVDANSWRCAYFDWRDGAGTVNPTEAARYAREVAGPKLAAQILQAGDAWHHIHLLGHSAGCWLICEAAKILAAKTDADLHLTFFDAYVPPFWQAELLCEFAAADANCWVEQYYTRDLTLEWTQVDLPFAHNVDVTAVNGVVKDHNFPWQWYYATVVGQYRRGSILHSGRPARIADGVEYGFSRSREAAGWQESLRLPAGRTVKLKKEP